MTKYCHHCNKMHMLHHMTNRDDDTPSIEDSFYQIGYRHGSEGLPEMNSYMSSPEYKMGYADGVGDHQAGHKFDYNPTLRAEWANPASNLKKWYSWDIKKEAR